MKVMHRLGRFAIFAALAGFLLAACSSPTVTHTITGTVTEAGAVAGDGDAIPLSGVTVSASGRVATTARNGTFELEGVPAGTVTVAFTLEGYAEKSVDLSLTGDAEVDQELSPTGGRVEATGATLDALNELAGSETNETKITLRGNVNDLVGADAAALEGAALEAFTTALTVSELQALVNGRVVVMEVGSNGNFSQEVPVDAGRNTIQLRVFDDAGHAYTSTPIVVTATFEQLDMRITLEWDKGGGTDVDLHLFKRNRGESMARPPLGYLDFSGEWWTDTRHVYYANKLGTDFGEDDSEWAFLDIDDTSGFGPETIVLQEATSGQYHVWVHLYRLPRTVDKTTATVDVEFVPSGSNIPISRTFTKTLTDNWEFWYVTTIDWESGSFTTANLGN